MKVVVQAVWLLTIAIGDGIIVLITLLKLFDNMAIELLLYAVVMLLVMIIFALISAFYYKYHNYTADGASRKGNDAIKDDFRS